MRGLLAALMRRDGLQKLGGTAQQKPEPIGQPRALHHAAEGMDALVGIQEPTRQPVSFPDGLRWERDDAAFDRLLIGLPSSIQEHCGNELGENDISRCGPLTADGGLCGRQGREWPAPNRDDPARAWGPSPESTPRGMQATGKSRRANRQCGAKRASAEAILPATRLEHTA
jgi:hypothetical protein